MVYRLTLKAETARMLIEMPAEAHRAPVVNGTNAVSSATIAQIRQTRARAAIGTMPCFAQRNESHPPAKPPNIAANGGSQANHAAWISVSRFTSTRYSVVQLLQSEYVTMLSALAITNPHILRSRRRWRLFDSGSIAEGRDGLCDRATRFHKGIQSKPSTPVATNATRQSKRTASQVATGGAKIAPRNTAHWLNPLPSARSSGARY